jgi:hypothetical protein
MGARVSLITPVSLAIKIKRIFGQKLLENNNLKRLNQGIS